MKIIGFFLALNGALLTGCATNEFDQTFDALRESGGGLYAPPHYMTSTRLSELNGLSNELGIPLTDKGKGFVYSAILDINRSYGQYINLLTGGKAGVNVVYDTLNLGLTGAATAINPVGTKTILAGLSTFFQGQKQSIDKNIFDDKAIFALSAIMEVRRSQVLKGITTKLRGDSYTLGEAVIDLDSMYRAGSLQTALQAAFLNQPGMQNQESVNSDGNSQAVGTIPNQHQALLEPLNTPMEQEKKIE